MGPGASSGIADNMMGRAPHRTVYGNGRIVGGPYTVTDRILRSEVLDTVQYGRITAVYGNTDV